jgi:hypothetical protein
MNEKLDALLRENEASVAKFLGSAAQCDPDPEGMEYRQLCSMFNVFGERLLREIADTGDVEYHARVVHSKELHELADRIKHRSTL